jgi:hypothetical protein
VGIVVCAVSLAAVLVAPGRSAAPRLTFPGGPYFIVDCGFSHRNNDDPIVFPGQPGRSHNHTYIGNRSVNAGSTAASLRGGATTCATEADASTYWVPTLFVGREAIPPLAGIVYYIRRTPQRVVPFPPGMKLVAGDQHAKRAQAASVVSWSCFGVGGAPRTGAVPACGSNQALQLRVEFPNCWNGKTVDSADHRRHMAYASAGRCPASHPVAVPTISLILLYPEVPRHAQPASGRFGAHADFMNGWDQDALSALVARLN